MARQENDGRSPETCGWSIGFDGVYVCRLCLLPCPRAETCPVAGEGKAGGPAT